MLARGASHLRTAEGGDRPVHVLRDHRAVRGAGHDPLRRGGVAEPRRVRDIDDGERRGLDESLAHRRLPARIFRQMRQKPVRLRIVDAHPVRHGEIEIDVLGVARARRRVQPASLPVDAPARPKKAREQRGRERVRREVARRAPRLQRIHQGHAALGLGRRQRDDRKLRLSGSLGLGASEAGAESRNFAG